MIPGSVTLKAGHVQPVWAGHPWVFQQAVERVEGGVGPGDEVVVRDSRGNSLGRGLYAPGSAITVRLYTRDAERSVDAKLFEERIADAVALRRRLGLPSAATTGYRLVHAEGDGLPGLIVDVFGDALVVQIGTIGVHRRRDAIFDVLERLLAPRVVLDRTPSRVATREGFSAGQGVVRGDPELPALVFLERSFAYRIPRELGQKTGYYFDQRPLRARVEELSAGLSVLDAHTFVGSLSLAAARGGAADVEAVDSSSLALETATECARDNGLAGRIRFQHGDAQAALDHAGRKGGRDLVICDPPKLAPTRAARQRGLAAMRKLCAAGCRATRPGGLFVVSSCSAALGVADLTRSLALGARDVGMTATVLERLFQGADHPTPAAFPEGLYLTSLVARVAT